LKALTIPLLTFTLLCFQASSQTPEPCGAAVQRMSLPTIALTDYDTAPLELLFSESGQDIYSATSYQRPDPLQWIHDHGTTVVIVYQDASVRQRQIESLRKSGSLLLRVGFPQHLENIKYSAINFFGLSASFVRDIEYFEPKTCVTSSEEKMAELMWMHYSDFQTWASPGLHASKNEPNWVTGFYSPYLVVSAKENPMYIKIHNVMSDKVKSYMDENRRSQN
jgi:hypothetical protein